MYKYAQWTNINIMSNKIQYRFNLKKAESFGVRYSS